jgi:hypothetical protein
VLSLYTEIIHKYIHTDTDISTHIHTYVHTYIHTHTRARLYHIIPTLVPTVAANGTDITPTDQYEQNSYDSLKFLCCIGQEEMAARV